MKLSEAQQRVVSHRGGDLQVIACAGSGKTESISRRVAALLLEGVEPAAVVAFTFTERAAVELKDRIVKRVAEVKGPEFRDRLGPMFVGTIHSYCFRLLQDHVPAYGNHDVLDDNRHIGLLSREHASLGLGKLGQRHWQPVRDFAKTVDVIGNELIRPEQLDGTALGECFRAYREMLERFRFLTFSSIISEAVRALEDPGVHASVHGTLRHLLVDEYQDINPAQERLIELLSQSPVELCVVGDDDQSIYQWRGADVRNILTFADRRQSVAERLLANRRSRPSIVTTANAFAASIPSRLDKAMDPVRPPGEIEIVGWSAATDIDEAEQVADAVVDLRRRGFRYRDIGVLFRSVRTSAPPLLAAFAEREVPFDCGGRTGLFLQPEASLFGEIFAWFVDGEWKDDRYGERRPADLNNIATGLARHFTPLDEDELRQYLEDWKAYQLRGQRAVSLVDDFYRLLARLRAHEIDIDDPAGSARFGTFARFSELLADFEHVYRRGRVETVEGKRVFRAGRDRGKPYYRTLHNYLLHWALYAYEDFAGERAADLDAVAVLTVHQAKGLEWPVVFLPSLVKGRFPSQRAGQAQSWLLPASVFPPTTRARYEGGDAEERRLFYVAMTRARETLYLSSFGRKQRSFRTSPYLVEVLDGEPEPLETLPLPNPTEGEREHDAPPLEIAFSDLAQVEECGHAYRLGSVFGFEQSLALELGYGRAVHHVLRLVAEQTKSTGRTPTKDEVDRLVASELFVPFASTPAFNKMASAARRLVQKYLDEYANDLDRLWAVERPFALHFEEGVVSGRADVILDEEGGTAGKLAVVDYKVSNDPLREERYQLQLAIYAAAGRGEGLVVDAAYLHELREGSRRPIDISPASTATATARARNLLQMTRAGRLEPRPDAQRCPSCEYRRICRHALNP